MTNTNVQKQELRTFPSLSKLMLLGGGITLILITIFLVGVNDPDPAWGKYWMLRPLIIVPSAGAFGGFISYHIIKFTVQRHWSVIVAIFLSIIIFMVGTWLGFVLGLDGTLWN